MKNVKFNIYDSGILEFGRYIESYGLDGNAAKEKEFIQDGKLFFSYQSIREQDKLKIDDTGKKVSIKIKVPYMTKLSSSSTINLDNELYSIAYIDPCTKKQSMYIYLTDLDNELDKHIEIYRLSRKNELEDKLEELYRIVWAKVEEISDNSKSSYDAIRRINQYKKVTIRYLKDLDPNININSNNEYLIKYKNVKYNINQAINVNDDDKLLELSLERR